jgi:hypothetical protein
MKLRALTLCALWLMALARVVSAQDVVSDNMQILREKLKADKKLVIAANLVLTESEAEKFWPIYDGYQKELDRLTRRLTRLISTYAEAYAAGTPSDTTAKELLQQAVAIGKDEIALDEKYIKRLDGVIPTIEMARYIQMENKIRALLKYELAAEIPLIE